MRITIKVKKLIIQNQENGVRVSNLALQYGLAKSSICIIFKNKEATKEFKVAKGLPLGKDIGHKRLLPVWVSKKQLAGVNITGTLICE